MACYVLGIKDRHNGNLLLTRDGALVHIDFGFVLGRAPGGVASLEASVPFKLTREMVDVLGGADDPLFKHDFVSMCTAALSRIRSAADELISLTEITMLGEGLPCFAGAGDAPLAGLRARLLLDVADEGLRTRVAQLVAASYGNMNTYLYDRFQKMSNGISE